MNASATVPLAPAPRGAGFFSTRSARDARHLLGLEGMSREELSDLLDDAEREREWLRSGAPNRDDLAGCSVMLAFIEDSTRTRTSFEVAARRLGANALTFSASASSLNKGETLFDTMKVFEAMGTQLLVLRHSMSGAAACLARTLERVGVLNAGDGMHEHPTQGLLDLLTLRDAWKGRFEGRRLAIVGDVGHSRVARSAIHGLTTMGAQVTVGGPGTLMPADVGLLGCGIATSVDEALAGADGVMALRIQRERMEKGLLPSLVEYGREWGIDFGRVALMKPDAVVLHPGPVNRGVELDPGVADSARSVILTQVANGVAVRCAVLKRCWTAWREAA
ncbi:MAG TPA: aspartate carbamoyltransferase catalytic subunit [Candidatus Acidoferrales bacterium]|nr:aspartate carbamoyltransferase catalytic subunit [Candidatus Acidoferrales bacterium]